MWVQREAKPGQIMVVSREEMHNNKAISSGYLPGKAPMTLPSPQSTAAYQVGIVLRNAREGIGWSIDDVSRRTGISPREVASIEDHVFTMFYGHLPLLETKLRIYARKTGVLSEDVDSMIRETIESLRPQLK